MLLHNLHYGLRQLRKNPGFAAVAITTLALGIGMTGAMFTVIYTVLLRPLPFAKSEQIVRIGQANQLDNHPGSSSLPNIRDWREQSQSFQDIAYWNLSVHNITDRGRAESVADVRCSANLFSLLKVQPALGRTFDSDEDLPGKGNVAVLSSTVWKGFFSSDPDIIGVNVELGADYYTVIGVMPEGFVFPLTQDRAIVWIPVQPKKEWEDRGTAMLDVVGRLNNRGSIGASQTELTAITNRDVSANNAERVLVEDYRKSITGDVRTSLLCLEAAVLAVWLIACINIVSLLLARTTSRRRETAIRCALGASQSHLLRQFFAESAVLGGVAGLLGLLLCYGVLWVLRFYLQYKLPFADSIHVNLPVMGAILLMSLISTLLVGLWPALRSFRTSPQEALREGGSSVGGSRRQRRVQDSLVLFTLIKTCRDYAPTVPLSMEKQLQILLLVLTIAN